MIKVMDLLSLVAVEGVSFSIPMQCQSVEHSTIFEREIG